jgi:hypothetical protein
MSAASIAFTAAALGLIVVGVSRTLLVLGLVGAENDDDARDGSESSDNGGRGRTHKGRGHHASHARHHHGHHGHHDGGDGPVAARAAGDEGELWQRGAEQRWMEGGGGDVDSWEDEGAEWDDDSAAGAETLYDSGTEVH